MSTFDYSGLSDLDLNIKEIYAIEQLWAKQRVNQAFWQETPQLFLSNYIRCLRSAIPCGAVPSVVAAQGILESGWFSTDSLFGVKATKLQLKAGQGTQEDTHEVVNGVSIPQVSTFFETPSVQNNFANYYSYRMRVKQNSVSFLPANAIGYLTYLQADPAYSTAGSAYIDSVMATIQSNGLQAFDHV